MSAVATAVQPLLTKPPVAGPGPGNASGISVPEANPEEARWHPVLGLPCQITIDLPLPKVTVADLLKLRVGSVLGTNWHVGRDVPLRVNGALIGWSEFEVVGTRLAVRLTELA